MFIIPLGGAIISTKILTLRHMEDDIEKAGSAKKKKKVSEKVVPVINDLKVKKLPPKKVESSSSDEDSSESEDEVLHLFFSLPFLLNSNMHCVFEVYYFKHDTA